MLFASFVADSTRYAAIYSGFAAGIFALIWTYLNWMILLLGASLAYYLQNPSSVAKRRNVQLSPELQEQVGLALVWLTVKPFSRGEPAPQQETLEQSLRVPGEVTRLISDKLIRAGVLTLAGDHGDRLMPGRALDLITVGSVLEAVRHDEDKLVARLPVNAIPEPLRVRAVDQDKLTFAELLQAESGAGNDSVREG